MRLQVRTVVLEFSSPLPLLVYNNLLFHFKKLTPYVYLCTNTHTVHGFFVHSQTVLFSTYSLNAIIALNYIRKIQFKVAGQSLGKTPTLNILMKKLLPKKI